MSSLPRRILEILDNAASFEELTSADEEELEGMKKHNLFELLDDITSRYTMNKEVGRTQGVRRRVIITIRRMDNDPAPEVIEYIAANPKKELIGVGLKMKNVCKDHLQPAAEKLHRLINIVGLCL